VCRHNSSDSPVPNHWIITRTVRIVVIVCLIVYAIPGMAGFSSDRAGSNERKKSMFGGGRQNELLAILNKNDRGGLPKPD